MFLHQRGAGKRSFGRNETDFFPLRDANRPVTPVLPHPENDIVRFGRPVTRRVHQRFVRGGQKRRLPLDGAKVPQNSQPCVLPQNLTPRETKPFAHVFLFPLDRMRFFTYRYQVFFKSSRKGGKA